MTASRPTISDTASAMRSATLVRSESEVRSFATLGRNCAAAAVGTGSAGVTEVVVDTDLASLYRARDVVALLL